MVFYTVTDGSVDHFLIFRRIQSIHSVRLKEKHGLYRSTVVCSTIISCYSSSDTGIIRLSNRLIEVQTSSRELSIETLTQERYSPGDTVNRKSRLPIPKANQPKLGLLFPLYPRQCYPYLKGLRSVEGSLAVLSTEGLTQSASRSLLFRLPIYRKPEICLNHNRRRRVQSYGRCSAWHGRSRWEMRRAHL